MTEDGKQIQGTPYWMAPEVTNYYYSTTYCPATTTVLTADAKCYNTNTSTSTILTPTTLSTNTNSCNTKYVHELLDGA